MTDKELLELAAKAAGIELVWHKCASHADDYDYTGISGPFVNNIGWNPLIDDGDALRLAVKLDMDVENSIGSTCTVRQWSEKLDDYIGVDEQHGMDRYAATRRAIVRAAAEVGAQINKK